MNVSNNGNRRMEMESFIFSAVSLTRLSHLNEKINRHRTHWDTSVYDYPKLWMIIIILSIFSCECIFCVMPLSIASTDRQLRKRGECLLRKFFMTDINDVLQQGPKIFQRRNGSVETKVIWGWKTQSWLIQAELNNDWVGAKHQ